MSRHQFLFSRGIGWGTTTEHGRRVATVHYHSPSSDGKPPPVAAVGRDGGSNHSYALDDSSPRTVVAAFHGADAGATAAAI